MFDTIIIGAGAAGLTAAIYGRRAGLSVLVLEKMSFGGQMAISDSIENYPAFDNITGWELSEKMYTQATALGADIRFEGVEKMELEGPVKRITTSEGVYEAKTVIVSTGVTRRKMEVPGEEEHIGKGVSYCATCDGAFFRNKKVAVVGGGNTAVEEALFLSNLCSEVYLIHRRDQFRAEQKLVDALPDKKNIHLVMDTVVDAVEGETVVTGLRLDTKGTKSLLEVNGVFVAIGTVPENDLFSQSLPLDASGYIQADETCMTPIDGVYAAGDCRAKPLRQIITATADGATAASAAAIYLQHQ